MPGGFDLGGLLKQAQALQERLASAQDELAKRAVEGTAGGGMVTVTVNGRLEVLAVRIDPAVLGEHPDAVMLQDLIVAATNAAIRAAQQMMGEEMGKLTGGLGIKIPGLG